jgi:hypothetical protein
MYNKRQWSFGNKSNTVFIARNINNVHNNNSRMNSAGAKFGLGGGRGRSIPHSNKRLLLLQIILTCSLGYKEALFPR